MPFVNLQPLAIDGVFRAIPGGKGTRSFDWYRTDVLARALPDGWFPRVGTTTTELLGHVHGLHCDTGYRVVTCVSGRVALVVVDVRVGAPTFGRWIPIDLDTTNRVTVVIPPETAWGFQAFTATASLMSLHQAPAEGVQIDPCDPALEIAWPLPVRKASGDSLAAVMPALPRATAVRQPLS